MDRRKIFLVVAVLVAALGAGLVLLYVQGAEERAADSVGTVSVYTVADGATLSPGELTNDANRAGKLVLAELPETAVLPGATADPTAFEGQLALTTLYPGEQLVPEKFGTVAEIEAAAQLPIPDGLVGYPVELDDVARVAGFTQPGSRVGAIITGTFPPAVEAESRLLLDQVQIYATGGTPIAESSTAQTSTETDEGSDAAPVTPANQYVIAVRPRDTLRLDLAQTYGDIQLVLLPSDTRLQVGDPITSASLFADTPTDGDTDTSDELP